MAIPRVKTEIENYLVYGIDERYRRIFFGHPLDWGYVPEDEDMDSNEFTSASINLIVRAIKRMEKDHPKKPIEIHLCSYGGDPLPMMYLIQIILTSTCQFKFFGGGRIRSCATWIMAVCDERWLYEDSEILLHDGSDGFGGKFTDMGIYKEESDRLQNRLNEIFVENSFMPLEFYESILQRDLYLTPQETIDLGLADKIVPHTKRGNLRKMRSAHMAEVPHHKTMSTLVNKLYKRVKMNPPTKEGLEIRSPKLDIADDGITIDNTPVIPKDSDD